MHVTVNRRFLIGLIATVIVSGAAIHGLHAVQINRQSGFLLENAHRAIKERQFEQAVNYFQKYVTLVPADMSAQAEFGLLMADQHMSQAAASTLEKVLRNEPDARRCSSPTRRHRNGDRPLSRCRRASSGAFAQDIVERWRSLASARKL